MKEFFTKLGKKLSNLWYYHKWKIVIGVFFALVLTICVFQLADREDYDIYMIYAGPEYIEEDTLHSMMNTFDVLSEKDEDGGKKTRIIDLVILSDEQYEERDKKAREEDVAFYYDLKSRNVVQGQIMNYVSTGEALICLFDPYVYDTLKEESAFVPLSDILGYKPENAFDDYSVKLKDTDFGKNHGVFDVLDGETLLCIRKMPLGFSSKTQTKIYEQHKEFFKKILEFKVD